MKIEISLVWRKVIQLSWNHKNPVCVCLCVCILFLIRYLKPLWSKTLKKQQQQQHSNDYRKQVDEKNEAENSKTLVYLDSVIMGMFFSNWWAIVLGQLTIYKIHSKIHL